MYMYLKVNKVLIISDLSIIEAFPCKCKLTDGHKSTSIEDEVGY